MLVYRADKPSNRSSGVRHSQSRSCIHMKPVPVAQLERVVASSDEFSVHHLSAVSHAESEIEHRVEPRASSAKSLPAG